jgi:hypothetical protein
MKKLLFTLVLGVSVVLLKGQDSTADLNGFIRRVQKAYNQAAYLEFKIKYDYANAGTPGQILESMAGEVEMDKGRSRLFIDGTETVLTGKYAIQVLPESKTIYISSAAKMTMPNPVSMLDSIFAHIHGVRSTLRHQDQTDILVLDFPPGQGYTRLAMTIESHTGYFKKITYSLSTKGLVSQEMIDRPGNPAPYQDRGEVTILFSDYRQGHFDDKLFREENFFTKMGDRFEPAVKYRDYHIFLASSNL